jgi:hypothetical protein
MTSSRIEVAGGGAVASCSTADRAIDALRAIGPTAHLVVDLTAFPELPASIRSQSLPCASIVGFAPHVREELLEAAAATCDEVLARGAVARYVERLAASTSLQSGER